MDISKARAIWLTRDIIAVPFGDNRVHASTQFELVASPSAGLQLDGGGGVTVSTEGWSGGGQGNVKYIRLEPPGECLPGDPSGCTPGEVDGGWAREDARSAGDKYPHVRAAGYTCLRLPPDEDVNDLLKCQLVVTARRDGTLQDVTSVQTHGAVDDLFGRGRGKGEGEGGGGGGGGVVTCRTH